MKVILWLVRKFLSIRYKVKLKWVANLKSDEPVLILSNHVALVDPRILLWFLWQHNNISPLASEKYYNKPIFKQIMKLFWTVPIWEIDKWANPKEVKKVFDKLVEALKSWKNLLVYPSGQIYRQWFESIKWKQTAYNIIKLMPKNTKVVWVIQRGLWWSMWSMARDNWKTWFFTLYWKAIYYTICNFIFFVPKREINIEIKDITNEINDEKNKSLNEFNLFLEKFFNNWDNEDKFVEKINYIKHFFYYDDVKDKKTPKIISGSEKDLNNSRKYDLSKIDNEIKKEIYDKIKKIKTDLKIELNDKSNLVLDLFFDSLDLAEIKSYIQMKYKNASNPWINSLKTIWDLLMMSIWKFEEDVELKECNWKWKLKKWLLIENIS